MDGITYLDTFPSDILTMTINYLEISNQIYSYLSHSKNLLATRLEAIWKRYWDSRVSHGPSIPSYISHELIFAMAEFGHLDLIKKLMDTRIGLNAGEFYFRPMSPFHVAVKYRQRKVASFFLDREVNIDLVDRNGLTALYYAVENGDLEMTKMLLCRGASPYIMSVYYQRVIKRLTPIGYAIHKNQPEIIGLLQCMKIDLTQDCVHLVVMGNSRTLPPLHYATVIGNVQMVKSLLECGVDPDGRAYGHVGELAPLHALVQYGLNLPWKQVSPMIPQYIEIIQLLIEYGADVSMWALAPECKRPIDLLTQKKIMDPRIYELLTPKL